jgi:hypothetical protein
MIVIGNGFRFHRAANLYQAAAASSSPAPLYCAFPIVPVQTNSKAGATVRTRGGHDESAAGAGVVQNKIYGRHIRLRSGKSIK